ncbi:MAG: hypothetical protein ACPGWS_10285 [Solirubrobacterales bacterium]
MIVTTRARNLGYTWTNDVEDVPTPLGSSLRVSTPPPPANRRGLRGIEREHAAAKRGNGSNSWRCELWVGSQRVASGWRDIDRVLRDLREDGSITIET